MKKARLIVASLIATAGIGMASGATPASATFFSYSAGIQVQNLSGSTANIGISFYDSAGVVAGTTSDAISGNSSKTYFPLNAVASGFNGSAIVSADQPVAAVVNVLGSGGVAAASYIGMQAGANSVQIPLLMKGNYGFNTWFKVQNVGSAATNITVNYTDGTNAAASNVAPGAAATFDQNTENHNATVFAATVSSSGQPLVASVIEESQSTMFAFNGFTGGSTNPVMPLINANNFGFITGVQIQNSGASATNVEVTYTSTGGATCTETQTIPANTSATFALGVFTTGTPAGATTNCTTGATFVGSARVTGNSASMPLNVIVNQLNNSTSAGEAYSGFDPSTLTNKVVMPLIMDRNYGYFTGFNIVNAGAAATNVTCTFTNSSVVVNANLAAGAVLNDVQQNKMADGYVGSAICTGDAGAKLAAVVNELGTGSGDQFLVYEAINTN